MDQPAGRRSKFVAGRRPLRSSISGYLLFAETGNARRIHGDWESGERVPGASACVDMKPTKHAALTAKISVAYCISTYDCAFETVLKHHMKCSAEVRAQNVLQNGQNS